MVGATLRLLLLAGSFTVGHWIAESSWAAAAALGVILVVFVAVLFMTPYRRLLQASSLRADCARGVEGRER